MEKRKLGKSNLMVTVLGFGAMELNRMEEKAAARLLNEALDGGINYIDTSPCYGLSEEFIGKAISHRRNEYHISTKCGCNISGEGPGHIFDRKTLLKNIDNSLRLLKTDYIDVWQIHGPMPFELTGGTGNEAIETMQFLKKEGKIRHIAVSYKNGGPKDKLYPAGFSMECIRGYINWDVFDVMQIVYGGLTRRNEKAIAKVAEKGIGTVIRGVIKKYGTGYGELLERARLAELCEHNESPDGFLIRYALSHPGIGTIIIGTANSGHLAENIKTAGLGRLPDDVYDEARRRLDSIGILAEEP